MFLTELMSMGRRSKLRQDNITPKQYVDNIVEGIKLWDLMKITNDKFIHTTDDYHVAAVQKIFKALYDKGDIYKSEYEEWYCTPCSPSGPKPSC